MKLICYSLLCLEKDYIQDNVLQNIPRTEENIKDSILIIHQLL
jgi:hypothetical protein